MAASRIRTSPSFPEAASVLPSGLKATELIVTCSSAKSATGSPVPESHIWKKWRVPRMLDPEAIRRPSALNATAATQPSCPRKVSWGVGVANQSLAV